MAEAPLHRHLSSEDLVELALTGSPAARAEVAGCAECSAALGEWSGFLRHVRSELAPPIDELATRRLAERVLERTTREDWSWRGDWRVVGRFVRGRLRSSPWSRVAAALLIFQLFALPVLGYYLGRHERVPGFRTAVLPPPERPTEEYPEPDHPTELPAEPELWDLVPEVLEVAPQPEDFLHWAALRLQGNTALAATAAPRTPVGSLLDLRARSWRKPQVLPTPELERLAPIELVLWCELWLDRFAVEGVLDARLRHGLTRLAPTGAYRPELRRLALSALCRARDYGLLEPLESGTLARELQEAGIDAARDPLCSGSLRSLAPLDGPWLQALEAAVGDEERADPVVQAWLALPRRGD